MPLSIVAAHIYIPTKNIGKFPIRGSYFDREENGKEVITWPPPIPPTQTYAKIVKKYPLIHAYNLFLY